MNQYVSFASQQPICASNIEAPSNAYRCVACRSDNLCELLPSVSTWSQNPAVVAVPAPCAQTVAIWTCSFVRVSEMCRISASAARKSADPNAGGGPGRNWRADLRNQGRAPGNGPPAMVAGVVLLIHNPGPTGMVPLNGVAKPSAAARATISAPTARPMTSPRANPGPVLLCAFTVSS